MRTRQLVLLGLGVFLVTLAPMIGWYASPELLALPRNYTITTTSTSGPDATAVDFATGKERQGAQIKVTRTIVGDAAAGSRQVAVWDVFTDVTDDKGQRIDMARSRLALDRRTGLPVHCCGEHVNGDATRRFEGYTYKLPYGMRPREYPMFDDKTGRVWPATFAGTETVQGLRVYRLVQNIEPTKVKDRQGSAGVFYSSARTYWVEPNTGVIVKGQDQARTTLRDTAGRDTVTVMRATVTLSDADVTKLVAKAKTARTAQTLLSTVVPVLAVLVGLLLIVFVQVPALARRGGTPRGGTHARVEPEPREPAAPVG